MIPHKKCIIATLASKPRASGDDPACILYGRTDLM